MFVNMKNKKLKQQNIDKIIKICYSKKIFQYRLK